VWYRNERALFSSRWGLLYFRPAHPPRHFNAKSTRRSSSDEDVVDNRRNLALGGRVLSLILASVWLYGVLSYLLTQRTGEIGVRMAPGARREQVVRMMLGDGLRPALYGLVLGLVASAGAVRLIESMLYGTQPLDPAIFATVAVLACLISAG